LTCASIAQAAELAMRLWNGALSARAITVLSAGAAITAGRSASAALLIDLAGVEVAVERSTLAVAELAGAATDAVDDDAWGALARLAGDSEATVLRAGVPASALGSMLEDTTAAGFTAWGHIASGAVLGHRSEPVDIAVIADLRRVAERHGGFLAIEAAPPSTRRGIDPAGGGDLELVRALRDQLDPGRVINPGRWGDGL
jgi:FAD/FMN-containing dehydrogenase